MTIFHSIADALREGFVLEDRTDDGYLVKKNTPNGWARALVVVKRAESGAKTALEAKAPAGMNPRWAAWLATEPETVQPWAFGIWIHARWREWQAETDRRIDARPAANEHDLFDEWLAAKVYGCGSDCNAPIGSDEPRDHTACLDVAEALEAVNG